jgi:hypothetical protein
MTHDHFARVRLVEEIKTVGNIALFAWIALIVVSMILPLVLKRASFRWMLKRRRKLQFAILALMIGWIMLLSLSGLFGGGLRS